VRALMICSAWPWWTSAGVSSAIRCGVLDRWYNDEHRHSGTGFHTPADIHHGHAELVRASG
jgi:hypothetical protein